MKRLAIVLLTMYLILTLPVFAEENDGGLLPLDKAVFSGVSTPGDAGWSADNGELTVETTGGFAGNNYLQLSLPAKEQATLHLDLSPYIGENGTFTLSFYVRLSGIEDGSVVILGASTNAGTYYSAAETAQINRWECFEIAFDTDAQNAYLDLLIPNGFCTKICLDALMLTRGNHIQYKNAAPLSVTGGPTEKTNVSKPLSPQTKRAIIWAVVLAAAGVSAGIAVLILPDRYIPFTKKK